MAIKRHRGPPGGASQALKGLEARSARYLITRARSTDASATGNAASAIEATVGPPLPLYRLTLQQATKANLLKNLRIAEWWYLILHSGQHCLVRLTKAQRRGRRWRFLSISQGNIVDAIITVAHEADQRWGRHEKGTLELRILDIPALAFRALWLHRAGHDHLLALSDFHGQARSASPDIVRYIRRQSGRKLQSGSRSSHLPLDREPATRRLNTSVRSGSRRA
jgi:hypothetical protein